MEQAAPPRSPGYEAGTAELPIFILPAARATQHCHSSLIKGINSKFWQSKECSLNVFTDALHEKHKGWGEATAGAVETTSPPVASVLVFLKVDCFLKHILASWLHQQLKFLCVCPQTFLINAFQILSNRSKTATVLTARNSSRQSL